MTQAEKPRPTTENEKRDHYNLWGFDTVVHDLFLVSLPRTSIIFFHFKFLQPNFRGGKGGTFVIGPRRHLTSLHYWYCHLKSISYYKFATDSLLVSPVEWRNLNTDMCTSDSSQKEESRAQSN